MDDDNELTNEYTETNADPYVDKTNNNEPENLNTKTVKKGDKIVYQVWLDTTNLKASDNIQAVGITDKYEADKLEINVADIKAYDSVTGTDVTSKFVITVNNGEITATSKTNLSKMLITTLLLTQLSSSLVVTTNLIFLPLLRQRLQMVWIL